MFEQPPAIVEQAPERPSLMSEMIARAVAKNPLETPVPAPTQEKPNWVPPFAANLAGGLGDIISTQIGLSKGGEEKGFLMPQNRIGNALALGGSHAITALLSKYLMEHNHPLLGKILGYGHGAIGGHATVHNINSIKQMAK
jgi:hypothetical protein